MKKKNVSSRITPPPPPLRFQYAKRKTDGEKKKKKMNRFLCPVYFASLSVYNHHHVWIYGRCCLLLCRPYGLYNRGQEKDERKGTHGLSVVHHRAVSHEQTVSLHIATSLVFIYMYRYRL